MSMCRVVSCIVGRGYLLWLVRTLGKIVSLCPASFCTPRPNLPWFRFLGVTQKTKIMASGPITLQQIDLGKWWKQWQTLFLGGSKITADGDCGHEIKRHLLLERKVMTNLDNILKNRDITLPIKLHLVKAMVFPVVMYRCESWTVKKAELQRIDAFEL